MSKPSACIRFTSLRLLLTVAGLLPALVVAGRHAIAPQTTEAERAVRVLYPAPHMLWYGQDVLIFEIPQPQVHLLSIEVATLADKETTLQVQPLFLNQCMQEQDRRHRCPLELPVVGHAYLAREVRFRLLDEASGSQWTEIFRTPSFRPTDVWVTARVLADMEIQILAPEEIIDFIKAHPSLLRGRLGDDPVTITSVRDAEPPGRIYLAFAVDHSGSIGGAQLRKLIPLLKALLLGLRERTERRVPVYVSVIAFSGSGEVTDLTNGFTSDWDEIVAAIDAIPPHSGHGTDISGPFAKLLRSLIHVRRQDTSAVKTMTAGLIVTDAEQTAGRSRAPEALLAEAAGSNVIIHWIRTGEGAPDHLVTGAPKATGGLTLPMHLLLKRTERGEDPSLTFLGNQLVDNLSSRQVISLEPDLSASEDPVRRRRARDRFFARARAGGWFDLTIDARGVRDETLRAQLEKARLLFPHYLQVTSPSENAERMKAVLKSPDSGPKARAWAVRMLIDPLIALPNVERGDSIRLGRFLLDQRRKALETTLEEMLAHYKEKARAFQEALDETAPMPGHDRVQQALDWLESRLPRWKERSQELRRKSDWAALDQLLQEMLPSDLKRDWVDYEQVTVDAVLTAAAGAILWTEPSEKDGKHLWEPALALAEDAANQLGTLICRRAPMLQWIAHHIAYSATRERPPGGGSNRSLTPEERLGKKTYGSAGTSYARARSISTRCFSGNALAVGDAQRPRVEDQ